MCSSILHAKRSSRVRSGRRSRLPGQATVATAGGEGFGLPSPLAEPRWTGRRVRRAGVAIAQLISLLTAVTASGHSAAAADRKLSASIVSAFDVQGKVRFCYDRVPELVYFQYDKERDVSLVEARSIDGHVRTIFQFPHSGDQRSLSCSTDGSTIAALDGSQSHLYIFKASQLSVYKFDNDLLYSVAGKYSLLSADGSMISVPGDPKYVSGPDVLMQMRFLRTERDEDAFFESGIAYVEKDRLIDLYQYSDGWKKQRSITKPPGYTVGEISRCGNHVVASFSDDYNARFIALDEQSDGRVDWLNSVGVRGLLRAFSSLVAIDGGYGRCVFPLQAKRDVRHVLLGIVTFDDEGMQKFDIEGPPLAWSDDEIRLSKDGCYALFSAFKQVPEIPEFTMRQQAVVAKLAARSCNF
jgi:hypothetical protein